MRILHVSHVFVLYRIAAILSTPFLSAMSPKDGPAMAGVLYVDDPCLFRIQSVPLDKVTIAPA
jgi:hypothetical protein